MSTDLAKGHGNTVDNKKSCKLHDWRIYDTVARRMLNGSDYYLECRKCRVRTVAHGIVELNRLGAIQKVAIGS